MKMFLTISRNIILRRSIDRVEIDYKIMKVNAYFVLLRVSGVQTEKYNVMVNSEELIGTTGYPTARYIRGIA
jgi:hypothetical protein